MFEKLLKRVKNKNQHIACCEPCHFSWEEENALQYLPEEVQQWLVDDHRRIASSGFKLKDLEKHIKEESVYFRKYLPPDILERIEADHLNHCFSNDLPYELNGKIYNP